MPGKPFQSKLGAHYEMIRAMRRKRATWDEIAAHLGTLGVTTNKGSLCAFFKRHSKRPYALGMEPDEKPPTVPATVIPSGSSPATIPAEDVDDLMQPNVFQEQMFTIKKNTK